MSELAISPGKNSSHLPTLAPPEAVDCLGGGDGDDGWGVGDAVAPRGHDDRPHGASLGRAHRGAVIGGWGRDRRRLTADGGA